MYKKWLFIISIFFLSACTNTLEENKRYDAVLNEIRQTKQFDSEYPFDIQVNQYQKKNNYEYSVIIDHFRQRLDKIAVLVYDKNQPNSELYANIGLLDHSMIIGIPKEAVQLDNMTKGIILNQESNIKEIDLIIYVYYEIDNQPFKKIIEVRR